MYCEGTMSCLDVFVSNIAMVDINGNNAISNSILISNGAKGTNELLVSINGTNDNSFMIHCNKSDICKINCVSNHACTHLQLYCYGVCLVDCDEDSGMCLDHFRNVLCFDVL